MEILFNKVMAGYEINLEDSLYLFNQDINELKQYTSKIKKKYFKNKFELCAIINGKDMPCSEDCKFCAQSCFYKKNIKGKLLDEKTILKDALKREKEGVKRYSIVATGKRVSKKELEHFISTYKTINKNSSIKLCASFGLLRYDEFIKLKEVGVCRYHCNLETSRENFINICTTHTYDEKIETIKDAKRAGLTVCSGGIIGLGETIIDRINMFIDLRKLEVDSVPLNVLNPIKGTPFYFNKKVSEEEVVKTICIASWIMPKALIRLAGGRNMIKDKGYSLFNNSINGTITGDLLTTAGVNTEMDKNYLKNQNIKIALL